MITANLILTIMGLLFILILLVTLYVWSDKSKKKSPPAEIEPDESFESLSAIIKNRTSNSRELHHAVETILARFGTISSHSIGKYKALLEYLCTHPQTTSQLILKFEKTLRTNNPEYEHELEKALAIGLAARG
jgi:hypothetical protein